MAFQVGLVNEIDTVPVTKLVPQALVWIVGSPYRIEVVLLHKTDVPEHIFPGDGTATAAVEFMPIHTPEQDPLAVEKHQTIFHFKAAETHIL